MTKWSGPIVVVLIFGIFIQDVKIAKIDWSQAGRNSSGPGGAALGHPLDQALDLLYSLSARHPAGHAGYAGQAGQAAGQAGQGQAAASPAQLPHQLTQS